MRITILDFPKSIIDPFLITSPETLHYNCIAWAFGDSTKWYWPDSANSFFWPDEIVREEKIECFIQLFKLIGYEVCENDKLDPLYEKIAIYTNIHGKPTHAARQLSNGYWTSKLGGSYDVTHSIFSMEDGVYGNATVYMRRKK